MPVTAYADLYAGLPNVPFSASSVLNNDVGSPLSVAAVNGNDQIIGLPFTLPSGAVVTIYAAGHFSFWPAPNSTTDSFSYTVTDGAASDSAVVTINFNASPPPPNQPPMAMNDEYSTPHDQALDVQARDGVLANDQDPNGDLLSATLVLGPQHGSVTVDANGGFLYSPTALYVGDDSFTYRASDGVSQSAIATVTIHVMNALPTAKEDRYHVEAGTTFTVGTDFGLLANDTDADDILTAALVTAPQQGSLTLNSDGTFSYSPGQGFAGQDSFVYRATDAIGAFMQATAYLTSGVAAREDAYEVRHGSSLVATADLGVLWNDAGFDSGATVALVQAPTNGQVSLSPDGSFTYTPSATFGTDQFSYRINGIGSSFDTAWAIITITNTAPTAHRDSYSVAINSPFSANVIANDYDPESDLLYATLVQPPRHGSIQLNASGAFTYTPETNYNGLDRFTYKASDGPNFASDEVPVELFVAQPIGPRATVSGTIRYDATPNPLPVRDATVILQGANLLSPWWYELDRGPTSNAGAYSLNVPGNAFYSYYRLVIRAQNYAADETTRFVSVKPNARDPYELRFALPTINANIVRDETIGSARLNQKAFWTLDAAITALRAHQAIDTGAQDTQSDVRIGYTAWPFGSHTPSAHAINLLDDEWKDWDVITHEYGHVVQRSYGFFPFSIFNARVLGGALSHHLGRNNRIEHPSLSREINNKLGFSEGFANFFSVFAQESDTNNAPTGWVYDAPYATRDMKYKIGNVEHGSDGGVSAGEDEELTVMRVLWDFYDNANSAADEGHDNVNLGFQDLFNLITNRNLPAVANTQVAYTLSNLWFNVFYRNPEFPGGGAPPNAANVQTMLRFGDVLQLNNIAPKTFGVGNGMHVNGVQTNQWSLSGANPDPVFKFWIPAGMPSQPEVAQLLNGFTIVFYNEDYSQRLVTVTGIPPSPVGNLVSWSPGVHWATIKGAAAGARHWVISGGLTLDGYQTGFYRGGPNDIQIIA